MSRRRRGTFWPLIVIAVAAVAVPIPLGNSASASCAGPYLSLAKGAAHIHLAPGSAVTVTGRAFVRGCDDTGGASESGFGCGSAEPRTQMKPMKRVALVLKQGHRQWRLEVENAENAAHDRIGYVTWNVVLPARLALGRAVLIADVLRRGADPLDARLPVQIR